MKYLVGIDVGTSACKTALFDIRGNVISCASSSYTTSRPSPGEALQDPRDWYAAACETLKKCISESGIDPRDVAGVGCDGQSWSCVALDKNGGVIGPSPIWMDNGSVDVCESFSDDFKEELFRLSGNPLTPNYVTAKLVKLLRSGVRPAAVLQSNGYIVYRLTGKITQDISQGYGWHCFDIKKRCWDEKTASLLGIPADILPPLYDCHAVIGLVTREAAAETGLAPGTPVVAGGVDSACAALGAGVCEPGQTQEQGGQSGGMSVCVPSPTADKRLILCAHVVPGLWLLQGGTTGGGGVVRWMEAEFGAYEKEISKKRGISVPALFDEEAQKSSPGSGGLVFLPYMSGERTPLWDPHAKGVFYGIDFSKTRSDFIRAAMEGVAYSLLHNLDAAASAGAPATLLRATGGSANSRFWTQMKADVTGLPVSVTGSDNSTNLGSALLAGVGTGIYPDFTSAVAATVREKRRHTPDPSLRERYAKGYSVYLELYEKLKDTMKRS